MIHVLGLLARAGHGKSTVANHLRDYYGVGVVAFAAPLKKIAKVVMDFSDDQLYGTQAQKEAIDPRYGMSARIFLQKLGTEGIREHLGEMTFCDGLVYSVRKDYANDTRPGRGPGNDAVYTIDDMRFPNEAAFVDRLDRADRRGGILPALNGLTIKIVCTDAPPSGNDAHASEAGIDRVEPEHIAATIVSSRAQGIPHLLGELERVLDSTRFAAVKRVLDASRARLLVANRR